ncbi:MAG: sigma-70 family RNA polymerase sigma factor [Clostridia bacterium]|nr:sigma-70 family RNA polymerase sigma factor [Clostridia bacterium]
MEFKEKNSLAELILAVRSGDESAFEKLVDEYKPMIDGVIRRSGLDARDVFSEACMSFYRAVSSYELGQSDVTFGLYAKICVQRCVVDIARREGKSSTHLVDSGVDVENIAVSDGVQAMLEHREQTAYFLSVAKEALSDFEFDVYRHWMLGYTTSDTASALGVAAKAVDNAKNRMWAKLRQRLSHEFK